MASGLAAFRSLRYVVGTGPEAGCGMRLQVSLTLPREAVSAAPGRDDPWGEPA